MVFFHEILMVYWVRAYFSFFLDKAFEKLVLSFEVSDKQLDAQDEREKTDLQKHQQSSRLLDGDPKWKLCEWLLGFLLGNLLLLSLFAFCLFRHFSRVPIKGFEFFLSINDLVDYLG